MAFESRLLATNEGNARSRTSQAPFGGQAFGGNAELRRITGRQRIPESLFGQAQWHKPAPNLDRKVWVWIPVCLSCARPTRRAYRLNRSRAVLAPESVIGGSARDGYEPPYSAPMTESFRLPASQSA
jgi:hypothetical protein